MYEISKVIENLNRNIFGGYFVEDRFSLISLIRNIIPIGATAGCGDSVTLGQLGVCAL